jgi:hypothetical protein
MVRKAGPVAAAVAALAFAGAASAGEPVVLQPAMLDAVTAGAPAAFAEILSFGVVATNPVPGAVYKVNAAVNGRTDATATAAGARGTASFSGFHIGIIVTPGVPGAAALSTGSVVLVAGAST